MIILGVLITLTIQSEKELIQPHKTTIFIHSLNGFGLWDEQAIKHSFLGTYVFKNLKSYRIIWNLRI